jgi:3-oxoacyl-[acyl-carrier-protein] synthase-3
MTDPVTTLQRIAAYVPEPSVPVEDLARQLGLNRYQARMYRRIRGLDRVRVDPDLDVLDFVIAPARELLRSMVDPGAIRYLIFAHSISDLTPADRCAAEAVCDRLELALAEPFAVVQNNCAGGLVAVDLAGELLRADGDPAARALVLTGEKHEARLVRLVKDVTIMGEAAAACLVGLGGRGGRVRSFAVRTLGQFSEGFLLAGDLLAEFNHTYTGHLIDVMQEALGGAGLTLADLTMVVPHNVNVSSWLRVCRRLGLGPEQVFLDNVAAYGHCYCNDPFLNLATMRERGLLVAGGRYLVASVGIGATYAAMVVEY